MLAKPEGSDESRAGLYGEVLPDLPVTEDVAEWWRELGCARDSANGPAPFTWQELHAFATVAGYDISPVEVHCLMDMSRAYSLEIADRSHLRKPPMERDSD